MKRIQPDNATSALLASAHSAVSERHEQTRAQLLDCLPNEDSTFETRAGGWSTIARFYVAGAMGVGTVAAVVALAMWVFSPSSTAVAMEQLTKALDQVGTYTYRMETVSVSTKDAGRTVRQVNVGRWRSDPVGLYATMNIFETLGTNTATPDDPRPLVELEEAHKSGSRGIIVDHLKKEYWWIDVELDAESIGNPLVAIYMIRQRRGQVVRPLGEKEINNRVANGYEIKLGDQPASDLGPAVGINPGAKINNDVSPENGGQTNEQAKKWEWQDIKVQVWVDPDTNLPIEFGFARRGEDFETTYRFTNLKWNVEFAGDAFDVKPPSDYQELEKAYVSDE